VRFAGGYVDRKLERELRAGPVTGLRAFLGLWRELLTGNGFRAGCPVLAVSIEAPADGAAGPPEALTAAAEVFAGWQSRLAASLAEHGADPRTSRQLATLVVAAVEGAVVMCRAEASTRPLDDVAAQLEPLVIAATTPA
jgi:hypothetical protein